MARAYLPKRPLSLPEYAVYAARGPNTLVSSPNCQIATLFSAVI